MSELQQYGRIEQAYAGTGELVLENSGAVRCSFEIAQISDGRLYALCALDAAGFSDVFNQNVSKLVGELPGNRTVVFNSVQVVSRRTMHSVSSSDAYVTLFGRDAVVCLEPQPTESVRLRFVLANFTFTGNEPFEFNDANGYTSIRLQLRLNIGDFEIVLRPLPDYDNKVSHIKATHGVDATCEAIVSVDSTRDRDDVIHAIDNLCLLLTLAKGRTIAWLHYDIQTECGTTLESYHYNATTKPYSSFELIPENPPSDIDYFVHRTFPNLEIQEPYWEIGKAIKGYTDAKIEGDYLEARALKMVVTMEHLKGRYLTQHNKHCIVPASTFHTMAKPLVARIREVLDTTFPTASKAQLDLMASHAQGLNWYPFGRALSELCNSVGLHTTSPHRRRFINTRNDLVHRFSFSSEGGTPWKQYSFLMTFVGEVILAILGYDGFYYDWTKHPSPNQMRKKLSLDL